MNPCSVSMAVSRAATASSVSFRRSLQGGRTRGCVLWIEGGGSGARRERNAPDTNEGGLGREIDVGREDRGVLLESPPHPGHAIAAVHPKDIQQENLLVTLGAGSAGCQGALRAAAATATSAAPGPAGGTTTGIVAAVARKQCCGGGGGDEDQGGHKAKGAQPETDGLQRGASVPRLIWFNPKNAGGYSKAQLSSRRSRVGCLRWLRP